MANPLQIEMMGYLDPSSFSPGKKKKMLSLTMPKNYNEITESARTKAYGMRAVLWMGNG